MRNRKKKRAAAADRFLPRGRELPLRQRRFPWINKQHGPVPPIGRASVADRDRRFSNLNELWRTGGAGERVPFRTTEGPRGWTANPVRDAATPSSLFPRKTGAAAFLESRLGVGDVAVVGAAGAESLISQKNLENAERRVEAALAAYEADRANGAKRRDLEDAITEMHRWEAAMNVGRGVAAGRLSGILGHRYHIRRPDIAASEAELRALRRYARAGK